MFTVLPFTINCCKSINHWKGYFVINSIKKIPGQANWIYLFLDTHHKSLYMFHPVPYTKEISFVIIPAFTLSSFFWSLFPPISSLVSPLTISHSLIPTFALLLHPLAPQSISSPLKLWALFSAVTPFSEPLSKESDRQREGNKPREKRKIR